MDGMDIACGVEFPRFVLQTVKAGFAIYLGTWEHTSDYILG